MSAPSQEGITFPDIFDKTRLTSGEFDKYIYTITFKTKGGGQKVSKGMTAAGNIRAIHPYLRDIKSRPIHFGTVGDRKLLCCVVKVTVTIAVKNGDSESLYTASALADGDVTGVPSSDTLVRTN